MHRKTPKLLLLVIYALAWTLMTLSALPLLESPAMADGVCCQYGAECPGLLLCCQPPEGAVPCAPHPRLNYCLEHCGSIE